MFTDQEVPEAVCECTGGQGNCLHCRVILSHLEEISRMEPVADKGTYHSGKGFDRSDL